MSTIGDLYKKLLSVGACPLGAVAMLGNIQAECSFRANDVERAKSEKAGWTDESYTKAVDSGAYSRDDFCHDKFGYGLCQWTWWERKQKLYDFCKKKNTSIGDANAQIEFIGTEIKKYTTPYNALCNTAYGDIEKRTRTIMIKYEAPANQTEANQMKRVCYAYAIYKQLMEEGLVK